VPFVVVLEKEILSLWSGLELCNLADLFFMLKQQHYTLTKVEKVENKHIQALILFCQHHSLLL